jgi:hypothetical protein
VDIPVVSSPERSIVKRDKGTIVMLGIISVGLAGLWHSLAPYLGITWAVAGVLYVLIDRGYRFRGALVILRLLAAIVLLAGVLYSVSSGMLNKTPIR